MSCRPVYLRSAAASFGLALLTVSCTPMSDLERTKDHLAQARESLVRSLDALADDIGRSLTEVDDKLADPTVRPEERAKLLEARARLIAATDKAAASVDRQLAREDLLPEERESLLTTQGKIEGIQARVTMASPMTGTRAIQQRLAELGYKPGPIDGIMGPRTRAAIRAFERDTGRPQSGEVSPALIEALAAGRTGGSGAHSADTR
jgi:hypothetical protein